MPSSRAWYEGWTAYENNESQSANPYERDAREPMYGTNRYERDAWIAGWFAAEREKFHGDFCFG